MPTTVLHHACTVGAAGGGGDAATAALVANLLHTFRHEVTTRDSHGRLPIHLAAAWQGAAVVGVLLHAAPDTATAVDGGLRAPLHFAAQSSGDAALFRLLLAATPGAATLANRVGGTPLHVAAASGNVVAARELARACPAAATLTEAVGRLTPLGLALRMAAAALSIPAAPHTTGLGAGLRPAADYLEVVRAQLPAIPPAVSLPELRAAGGVHLSQLWEPLCADVAMCWRMEALDWQLVPTPCPGLGRALPAVLARSEAEAAHLVARLLADHRARLRAAALALQGRTRRLQVWLPASAVRRILSTVAQLDAACPAVALA